jgi:hypothetical protein
MTKFYGTVGYAVETEIRPGVWIPKIEKRTYYGDVVKIVRRVENGGYLNDNITIGNQFSLVADDYAFTHMHMMRYIEWQGAKWAVKSVEVNRPRLVVSVGGVYNAQEDSE